MVMSKVSRSVKEDPGDDGDEERHPRMPDEPENKSRDRGDTQVDPGGETETERNESVALESTHATVDREAAGTCRDAQVEVESTEMCQEVSIVGEKWSAIPHRRSMTKIEDIGQRTSADDDIVPWTPHYHPPPFPMPDEPAQ